MRIKTPRTILFFLMIVTCGGIATRVSAQPRDKCTQERADAESRYLDGAFDEAIALLHQCLDRETLFASEAEQVYRLLALSYMNSEDLEQAQQAIRNLLEIVPNYAADPVQDPPSYRMMVSMVKETVRAQTTPAPREADHPPAAEAQEEASVQEAEPVVRSPQPQTAAATPKPMRRRFRSPKSWLLATGGAIVVATAVAITLGGGSSNEPVVSAR